MRFNLLRGVLPLGRAAALRDLLAGVTLASMDIPQVLGYARIAGMPAVTGLYTAFLVTAHKPGAIAPGAASPLTCSSSQDVGDDLPAGRNKFQL